MRSHATCSLVLVASLTATSFATLACSSSDESHRGEVTFKTALVQYRSCAALETDLKELLVAEMEAQVEQNSYWGPIVALPGGPAEDDANGGSPGRQEGVDYSGTNNQEEGVDEADIVKTDGYNIYLLDGNRLHIFAVPESGQLVPQAEFTIEGHPQALLVDRDAGKAIVFSYIQPFELPADHPLHAVLGHDEDGLAIWRVDAISKLTIVDITRPDQPTLARELFLEGNYQTARLVDSTVRVASYSFMNIPGLYDLYRYYDGTDDAIERITRQARQRIEAMTLAELIPQIYVRQPDGRLTTHGLSQNSCRSFYRPENSHGRGYTSILSIDLLADSADGLPFDADHIVSNQPTIYASRDSLYVAEPANDFWWFWWNQDHPEQLNVHMFDIGSAGRALYMASGRVEGAVLNQFSLDEHAGHLRIATTTNRWRRFWVENPPEPDNHVYVLRRAGRELVQVGHVAGLGRGEQIYSVRMVGDRGYVVTFRQIDPLFTLDLGNPENPHVVGEIQLPGFSTYIHPIAANKLLTIGVGGDPVGANWITQISMFDVGNFARPTQQDREELVSDGSWGWSEALYEHKAFQYFAPRKLLAVPLSASRYDELGWHYVSTLELIRVDPITGLSSYGSIDHTAFFQTSDPEQYWYYTDVRRSIFMGDYIYAISDRGITVHDLADPSTPVAIQTLPGYRPEDIWWWW